MNEIIFMVEEDMEGGYVARALGADIFSEADDLESLKEQIKDAVRCHFDPQDLPRIIRLHIVKDEVVTL
ncbi:MAG: 2-oxoisovalerate dehydrogenase [Calditrichia bacterium]